MLTGINADYVSPALRSFLRACFQRAPHARPSASDLLQHRFITGVNATKPWAAAAAAAAGGEGGAASADEQVAVAPAGSPPATQSAATPEAANGTPAPAPAAAPVATPPTMPGSTDAVPAPAARSLLSLVELFAPLPPQSPRPNSRTVHPLLPPSVPTLPFIPRPCVDSPWPAQGPRSSSALPTSPNARTEPTAPPRHEDAATGHELGGSDNDDEDLPPAGRSGDVPRDTCVASAPLPPLPSDHRPTCSCAERAGGGCEHTRPPRREGCTSSTGAPPPLQHKSRCAYTDDRSDGWPMGSPKLVQWPAGSLGRSALPSPIERWH